MIKHKGRTETTEQLSKKNEKWTLLYGKYLLICQNRWASDIFILKTLTNTRNHFIEMNMKGKSMVEKQTGPLAFNLVHFSLWYGIYDFYYFLGLLDLKKLVHKPLPSENGQLDS